MFIISAEFDSLRTEIDSLKLVREPAKKVIFLMAVLLNGGRGG